VRLLFASVSFPLRDASRPRVTFRLWTLCLLFPLRSSVQNQIWENNSDVITCLFMFVCPCHICHVYMLSLACWNFTYQELSGGWVGSSLTFCHAVFILMRQRGSLQHRGHIGYATPLTFGTRSKSLQFSRFQFFSFGFVTAVAFVWWILSPYMDE